MEYNKCKTCKAKDGRAGNLINGECFNCHETRVRGEVCIYANLQRSEEEIKRTMAILDKS